jgi:polyhydroxyalkanoate synthesis regulator phasin
MSDEKRQDEKKRMGLGEGIRSGIGILSALKEAVEESIQEAVDRGDLSPDRAKEAVQGAMRRAQEAMQDTFGDVRERLDVVPRREFDELRAAVAELSRRVDELEGRPPVAPDHLLPPT